ncbi:MAG: roadblock/LC7 domain-containing protein [Verrucomicrobiota bacterium]
MFGIFKKLFGGKPEEKSQAPVQPANPAPAGTATPKPQVQQPARPAKPPSAAPAPAPHSAPMEEPSPVPLLDPADVLELPLKPIIAKLPKELHDKLTRAVGAKDVVKISRQATLTQLSTGVVKVTYAELRSGASGLLAAGGDLDHTQVEIPLGEIIAIVGAAALPKRSDQKRVALPNDIGGLFGPKGKPGGADKATVIGVASMEAARSRSESAPVPAPAPLKPAPAPEPEPPKPVSPPEPEPPQVSVPPPPPAPTAPLSVSPALREMMAASSAPAAKPASAPTMIGGTKPAAPAPKPAGLPSMAPAKPAAPVTPAPAVSTPAPAPAVPAGPVVAGMITVPVNEVSANWPEAIKQEIAKLGLDGGFIFIPTEEVGRGLKFGKVAFTWQQLLGWVKPAPSGASAQGSASVDLPLKVVAPLYLSQHKPQQAQKKLAIDSKIPDMFGGKTAAAPPPPAPAPVPVVPPPPVAASSTPVVPIQVPAATPAAVKLPTTLGELFGQPGRTNWELNDIVQHTAALPGVAGTLLAFEDGMLVAAQLPPDFKSDTVAAFIPQIFNRMNQYARDIGMGDVTALTLKAGKCQWQICQSGAVFFAAVSRPGECLPAAHINLVAEELQKQK